MKFELAGINEIIENKTLVDNLNSLLNKVYNESGQESDIRISDFVKNSIIDREGYNILTATFDKMYFNNYVNNSKSVHLSFECTKGKLANSLHKYFILFLIQARDNNYGKYFNFSKALEYSSNNDSRITEGKKYLLYTSK